MSKEELQAIIANGTYTDAVITDNYGGLRCNVGQNNIVTISRGRKSNSHMVFHCITFEITDEEYNEIRVQALQNAIERQQKDLDSLQAEYEALQREMMK